MARPPKPPKLHVVDGTFRKDRHEKSASAPSLGGEPRRPEGLDEFGAECWSKFVEPAIRMGVADEMDTVAIAEACRLYSFYRRSCVAANVDPTDKNPRCAVTAYWAAFEKLAARYGLTPADRIKLAPSGEQAAEDPADKHFRGTA